MQDTIALLEKLGELRSAGLLTEAEFENQKRALLSQQPPPEHPAAAHQPQDETADSEYATDEGQAYYQDISDGAPLLQRITSKAKAEIPALVGALLFAVGLSYFGFGSAQIRWALMTDQQLKQELLAKNADSTEKVFECFQSDGDCDAARDAASETYALADKLCQRNPNGNACFMKDQAAREASSIDYVKKTFGDLQSNVESSMTNSL